MEVESLTILCLNDLHAFFYFSLFFLFMFDLHFFFFAYIFQMIREEDE